MVVDATSGPREPRFKRKVGSPHRFPIGLKGRHRTQAQPGVALGVLESCNEGRKRRLARCPRHGRVRSVDSVNSSSTRGQECGQLPACRVVSVQVNWSVESFPQGRDQSRRCFCTQQPSHVLDREDVCSGLHHFFGQTQVVVKGVQIFSWVEQVPGVAQSHFSNRSAGVEHGIDCGAHVGDVIESIKDTEDIDATRCCFLNKGVRHLSGIGGITHCVSATQQHLDTHIGQSFAQCVEAIPGVLPQEAQGNVIRCPSPRFNREQLRGCLCDCGKNLDEVFGPDPRRKQRLVSITECRLCDCQRTRSTKIFGESFRTQLHQTLF